jgi:hypothetical protein
MTALDNFARTLAIADREARRLTPREQAEGAYYAGGPSVDELEQRTIAWRTGTLHGSHEVN